MAPTTGERFECRVARLLAAEGAFVRRRVDLQRNWGERFTITDVDLYVLRFTDPLLERISVGECKATETKSAPGVPDRLLWVVGVQRLVGADAAFVAVQKRVSPRQRRIAEELACALVDERDLARRENLLGLTDTGPPYAHDPILVELERTAQREAKKDQDLDRVYWFLRSEFWFQRPIAGLKRALGALRLLGRQWAPSVPEPRRTCVEWLTFHAIVACVVAMTRLSAVAYRTPEDTFGERTLEQLAEGKADYEAMREISTLVDKYVYEILVRAGVRPDQVVDALGAFAPKPPSYSESLIEVLLRLAAEPHATRQLPVYTDERVARLLLDIADVAPATPDDALARLLRLVLTFLRGQAGLPEALSSRFLTSTRGGLDATQFQISATPKDADSDDSAGQARESPTLFEQRAISGPRTNPTDGAEPDLA